MNSISELTCLTSGQTFTLELTYRYLEMFSHMCTSINDHKGMNWVMNPIGFCDDVPFSVMLPSGQSLSFRVSVT